MLSDDELTALVEEEEVPNPWPPVCRPASDDELRDKIRELGRVPPPGQLDTVTTWRPFLRELMSEVLTLRAVVRAEDRRKREGA